MGLNSDMQSLIYNIKQPLVFYLSRNLFENAIKKNLSQLENLGLFNSLVILNYKGETKQISNAFQFAQVSEKGRILKSNVFELLELKSKLDKKAFHYLINEYFKELNNWVIIVDAVRKEAKTEANNYQPYMQSYLEFQYKTFKTHQEELESHFLEWKKRIDLERFLGFVPSSLKVKIDKKELNNITNNNTTKQINKKTKAPIIREEEIDSYLLKTVFNVDVTTFSNKS